MKKFVPRRDHASLAPCRSTNTLFGTDMRVCYSCSFRTCLCACVYVWCRYTCSPSPSVSNMYSSRTFMLRHHVRKLAMLSRANQVPDRALLLHFGAEFGISCEKTRTKSELPNNHTEHALGILSIHFLDMTSSMTFL